MKPFDLELAKAGHPVCTRDGRAVRILCHDRKSVDGYSMLALVDEGDHESFIVCTSSGKFYKYKKDDPHDLFMSPVKKEGWINIYKELNSDHVFTSPVYKTLDEANKVRDMSDIFLGTSKIEWEE